MPPPPALSLVMPLFNEERGVEGVVAELIEVLRGVELDFELILVNNGSHDATGALIDQLAAQAAEIRALHLPVNAGYGGGILEGLAQARGPVVGYLWGDGQVLPGEVVNLYELLLARRLDLVKARRRVRLDGWQRVLLTRLYHHVLPLVAPLPSEDVHGGPRLMTRAALEVIQPRSRDWFIDLEIMLKAQTLGLSVGEIDVVFYPRRAGRSKVRWATVGEFVHNLARYRRGDHPAFQGWPRGEAP